MAGLFGASAFGASDGRAWTHLFLSEAVRDLAWTALAGALALTLLSPTHPGPAGSPGGRVRARLVALARSHAWIVLLMLPTVLVLSVAVGAALWSVWALVLVGPLLVAHAGLHATDAALAAVWSAPAWARRSVLGLVHVALFSASIVSPPLLSTGNPYVLLAHAVDALRLGGGFPLLGLVALAAASVGLLALPVRERATEGTP